jgi:NADH dehydrogenase [ubiquinone] 1 alpha subcomplex assembly factor 7
MTPLEKIIRDIITTEGPMPLDRYMGLCLGHPEHGYYMTRDPFGREGDFTTAPEVSQVFGELIGVWVAQVWHLMGSPGVFSLIELGPGRGTLMKDILRASAKIPGLHLAAKLHLVETSPVLQEAQRLSLCPIPPHKGEGMPKDITWHTTHATLPSQPSIIVANEFFDAIPIRQFELRDGELFERCVAIEDDKLAYGLKPTGQSHINQANRIYETAPARSAIAKDLASLIAAHNGAALFIDYGHRKSSNGDTLQAMKDHAYCSIFETPGEADLTSHVDFEQLLKACAQGGATPMQLLTQGEFLNAMGLQLRTETLAHSLDGDARDSLLKASHRLADGSEMGQLFKVAAITHNDLPMPYPFGSP